jgi:hypothetical protein
MHVNEYVERPSTEADVFPELWASEQLRGGARKVPTVLSLSLSVCKHYVD